MTILNMVRRYRTPLIAILLLVIFGLGLAALHGLAREIHISDIRAAVAAIPPVHLVACLGLTAMSYFALTFHDYLALKIIARPLQWRTAALASFISHALSHNLGFSWLTGSSARYRIYTAAGLAGADVARIVAITAAMAGMGIALISGAAFALHDGPITIGGWSVPQDVAQIIGAVILLLCGAFVILCATGTRRISAFGWTLPLPDGHQAAAQFGIAAIDLAAAGAALFVLVPGLDASLFPAFILAYSIALIVAILSHVPGGIGVFEAVLIALFPGDKPALLAALLLYRLIYDILPLAIGIALLAFSEGARWRHPAGRSLSALHAAARSLAPLAMAIASFAGGAILLLSGSLPAVPSRLRALAEFLPLPFIEASHIAASVAGTALLLLAPGLLRRLDGAFVAVRALLLAGALFSLFKGFDYEEAIVCLAIAALLQWTRPAFYRKTALTSEPLSVRWLAAAAVFAALAIWAGFFAYKQIGYRDQLWWQFALDAEAPRFLRATLAALLSAAAFACWRLLAPAKIRASADASEIAQVRPLLSAARHSDAMLALTGDKRFLLSPGNDAFLMYQVRGASWIVMSDPVGPKEKWAELLWEIRSMADAAQGRLLLYQIGPETLEVAIDLGLQIVKYGEEAIVELANFSLDGSDVRSLRHAARRAERDGLEFSVVPSVAVPALIAELRLISEAWLSDKGHGEKGFSLGRFDPAYLAEFDCAIAKKDGQIVAFANIWTTADRQEASIDLMRHGPGAPSGTMDFLFVQLMLWAKAEGFRDFSLGLAPLSGIEARPLAPRWAKIAGLLFNHGERFYGFRGLRAYKEKFRPVWLPRYIAGPQGLGMIAALIDLNVLIGKAEAEKGPSN